MAKLIPKDVVEAYRRSIDALSAEENATVAEVAEDFKLALHAALIAEKEGVGKVATDLEAARWFVDVCRRARQAVAN